MVHQVKKIDGVWVQPAFVRTETVDLPDGSKLRVKAGTQFIDGVWRIIRRDARDSLRQSRPELVDKLARVPQRRYWHQDQDVHQNRASPFASDFHCRRGYRREFRSEDHFYPFFSQKKSRFASGFLRRGNLASWGLKKSLDYWGSGRNRRRSRRESRDFGALRSGPGCVHNNG